MIKLEKILKENVNIAKLISDEDLALIVNRVNEDFNSDEVSNSKRKEVDKHADDLANQVYEIKMRHGVEGANIKYPLLTKAAIQFASKAYPAMVQNRDIVKPKITGRDEDGEKGEKGKRKATYLNYQMLEEIPGWEESFDMLLHVLPIRGQAFKKTYRDKTKDRSNQRGNSIGIVSEFVPSDNIVIHADSKPNEVPQRISQTETITSNNMVSMIKSKKFLELKEDESDVKFDKDKTYDIIEQHGWLDLDGDGYKEPYQITICKDPQQVLRIMRRFDDEDIDRNDDGEVIFIDAINYYTRFPFIPSLDGKWNAIGWGHLLGPINRSVNTSLNQLIDAATMANNGGGFIGSELRNLKAGSLRFKMNEYQKLDYIGDDIRKAIVHFDFKGPSPTTFSLLQFMINAGEELGSTDITPEKMGKNASPTTTLALIEEASQVPAGIQKRLHRALREEIKKIERLNRKYLDEEHYYTVLDEEQVVMRDDFGDDGTDVQLISDPSMVSSTMKMAKAQALMELIDRPETNSAEIIKQYLQAVNVDNIEAVMDVKPEPPVAMMMELQKLKNESRKLDIQDKETEAKIMQLETKALENIANAESKEAGDNIAQYAQVLEDIRTRAEIQERENERMQAQQQPSAEGAISGQNNQ